MRGRIEIGDMIVAVDGKPVETIDDLMALMEQHKVGDQVTVDYVRGNRKLAGDGDVAGGQLI